MDRRTSTEGFTMVEMCIVILGISLLAVIVQPAHEFSEEVYLTFGDSYLKTQSEAIVSAWDRQYISADGKVVLFNENGNVRRAETLSFGRQKKKIIIELGGGRLVYR